MSDLRTKLLNTNPHRLEMVVVPELNTTLFLKTLNGVEVKALKEVKDEIMSTVALVCAAVCDEQGNRVFHDTDTDSLRYWPWHLLERLAMKALTHNALIPEAIDDAKKVCAPTQN